MKRVVFLCFVIILGLNINNVYCSGQKEETSTLVLKHAHGDPPNSPDGKADQMLADRIKERSKGKIEISIYPSEQLGSIPAMLEAVQIGTIDITKAPGNTFTSYSPIFGIEAIPYLFQGNDVFSKIILETGLAAKQKDILEKRGMMVLNQARNYFKGPYRVIYSKKPIKTVNDFVGLRFRSFGNKQYAKAYEMLGANPIVIPWGETYMALKQGIVEAGAGNMSQIKSMGFTEVAPYVIKTNEYYSNIIFVMNIKRFNSLTPEYQKIILESCDESFNDLERLQKDSLDNEIQWMKQNHKAEFSEIDTNPIRDKLKDFYYGLEKEGILPQGMVDSAFSIKK